MWETDEMTPRERAEALAKGQPVDRMPLGLFFGAPVLCRGLGQPAGIFVGAGLRRGFRNAAGKCFCVYGRGKKMCEVSGIAGKFR